MTSLNKFRSYPATLILIILLYILPVDIDNLKPRMQTVQAYSSCIEIETVEPGYDKARLYNDRLNAQSVRYENGQTIVAFRASSEVISVMIQDREHVRYFYSHLINKSRVKNPTANMQSVRLFQCTFDTLEICIDENVSESSNKLPNLNEMLNMFIWLSPAP